MGFTYIYTQADLLNSPRYGLGIEAPSAQFDCVLRSKQTDYRGNHILDLTLANCRELSTRTYNPSRHYTVIGIW